MSNLTTEERLAKIQKLLGNLLVFENSFTPWGEDQVEATRLWRLGHKLRGTPGFKDVSEDGTRK